jgi:hypothetical protein
VVSFFITERNYRTSASKTPVSTAGRRAGIAAAANAAASNTSTVAQSTAGSYAL